MAIDSSIPLQTVAPDINPLAALAQVQGYKNAQAQNQLLNLGIADKQREVAQMQGLNTAFQSNVGADGTVNQPGVIGSLASGGYGAAIPAVTKQFADANKAKLDAQKIQLDNASAHLTQVGQLLNGAKDQQSYDAVKTQAAQQFGPDSISDWPAAYDPNVVAAHQAQALTYKDQIDAQQKALDLQLKGATLQETGRHNVADESNQRSNIAAHIAIAGGKPVSYNDPQTNQPRMTNVAGFNQMLGNGSAYGTPSGAAQGAPATGDGRYPTGNPAQAAGNMPQQPQQQQPLQPQQPASIGAGLSPADAAAAGVVGKGAADQYVADQAGTNGFANRTFQLQKALTALQNTTTGAGSDRLNTIKSYLQTAGVPGIDPNKISSYDEANKYLTQYAIGQAGALGQGTNEKLATTLSGNASTSISNLAAQDVVKANIGLERMKQAQVQAFNASGLPASQYQKFSTQWNSQVDPRVFIFDQLTPDKKAAIRDNLSPAQKQTFTQQYNTALQNGWIQQPGQ